MDRTPAIWKNTIRICLILAPILASVMSLTSDYNRHPDEIHHFEAARYYATHFLPPEIGDPTVRDSYSVWGVSYLNYHWIEYLLAGKFILVGSLFGVDPLIAARLFNVALLAGVVAFFLYRSRDNDDLLLIPSVLLLSPQVWYVFSYVNNDAFPLAVGFIAAYQIAHPKSALNESAWGTTLAGLLIGLLLISKTNYYALIIFFAIWFLYRHPPIARSDSRLRIDGTITRRLALIALIALSVLAVRCSLDFYVNGETNFVGLSYVNYFLGDFEKKESKLLKYQEEVADTPFKPSAIERDLAKTFPEMRLKDKGAGYTEIFTKWRWHETSFKSFVGVYGYMNIFASNWYYRLMLLMYLALAAYLLSRVIVRRSRDDLANLAIFLIGAGVSIFISSYLSWSYALQAQGRYLFPILPLLGCFLYSLREVLNRVVMNAILVICFIASVYSFLFVGVRNIDTPPDALAVLPSEASTNVVIGR